jgi:predicted P-loop ATPase
VSTSTEWRAALAYDRQGKPRGSSGNVLTVLEGDEQFRGCVAWDAFAGSFFWTKRPPFDLAGPFPREVRDGDELYVCRWLEQAHEVFAGAETVRGCVAASARANEVDALRTYLDALKWDGRRRLDTIHEQLGVADSPYARAVCRRFILSMVARGTMPGCKVDTMLILEGPQGRKKSTALRVLAGAPWFSDSMSHNVEEKDAVLQLGSRWLIEFGEFDRFSRNERGAVKHFASKQADRIRPPYGRAMITWERRCTFVGSTNESDYLDDPTGDRRYWPVTVVRDVNVPALAKYRDQIFAEAMVVLKAHLDATDPASPAYIAGQWWLTTEEDALRTVETDRRQIVDPWSRALAEWMAESPWCTTQEALKRLNIDISKATKRDQMRIGDVFKRAGLIERKRVRVAGDQMEWRYTRPSVPTVPTSGPEVGTEKASENTAVPTVPTVPTSATYDAHARAQNTHTGRNSRNSGHSPEKTAENLFLPREAGGNGGNSAEADIDDMWGGP